MKVSIDIGHGWCAAMSRCDNCTYCFVVVRQRKNPIVNVHCPSCGYPGKLSPLESPWSGIAEVDIDGEYERT